jgi:hypothetical protein
LGSPCEPNNSKRAEQARKRMTEVSSMETIQQNIIVANAKRFLAQGQAFKAGMLIFERIPLELRPEWCTNIFELAYQHISPLPEIETLLDFVKHPEHWPLEESRRAHGVFDAIPQCSSPTTSDERIYQTVLYMAENVAGITYTSRQFTAPFDHNRGWRIAENISEISQFLDDEFANKAWQMHFDPRYIQLDIPVSCSRGCPICHPPKWDYLPDIKLRDAQS